MRVAKHKERNSEKKKWRKAYLVRNISDFAFLEIIQKRWGVAVVTTGTGRSRPFHPLSKLRASLVVV